MVIVLDAGPANLAVVAPSRPLPHTLQTYPLRIPQEGVDAALPAPLGSSEQAHISDGHQGQDNTLNGSGNLVCDFNKSMKNEKAREGGEEEHDGHEEAALPGTIVHLHVVVELEEVQAGVVIIEDFHQAAECLIPCNIDCLFPFIVLYVPVGPFHQQSPHDAGVPILTSNQHGCPSLFVSHIQPDPIQC